MERKQITKKLRFEVFKRDNFSCIYCGNSPPNVVLEVDHFEPVSKGGDNSINNLVTSCFNCNRGKSNIRLANVANSVSKNLIELQERELQIKEYNKFIKKIKKRLDSDIEKISSVFTKNYPREEFTDSFKKCTITTFLNRLPLEEVIDAIEIAVSKKKSSYSCLKYFCGICWTKIKRKQGDAF